MDDRLLESLLLNCASELSRVAALEVGSDTCLQALKALEAVRLGLDNDSLTCPPESERQFTCVFWSLEDVQAAYEDFLSSMFPDTPPTESQKIEVLRRCYKYHDSDLGVNWGVLTFHLGNVLGGT